MSSLTQSLIRAEIGKLHRKSNHYVMTATVERSERVRFFLFRRAWQLFAKAEELSELVS